MAGLTGLGLIFQKLVITMVPQINSGQEQSWTLAAHFVQYDRSVEEMGI
jgi:hypothetical protein